MTDPGRPGVVAVDSGLIAQTLVEAVFARAQQLDAPAPPDPVGAALADADLALVSREEAPVEREMRHAGYLARVVEAELFDPAKQPAAWLEPLVRESLGDGADQSAALVALCGDLARAEPAGKPAPDDPAATTWRVPGPGGHVRHYVARRTIEDRLQGRDRPFAGDPADLKIPWVYGFLLRACEEVLTADGLARDAGGPPPP